MLKSVFLEDLRDLLQRDDPIDPDMELRNIAEWDSLAMMSCIAYFDKNFSVKTTISQFTQLRTISDLVALSGGAIA
ncbi:MAG: acyl carrier protein [Syntrophorhabdaceae bacterium]|nr:acyl carrier protein [Syntrophorhabdaceae bacterium]